MLDVAACDGLVRELRTLLATRADQRADAILATLFKELYDDDAHRGAACGFVHDRGLPELFLAVLEHLVDADGGALHLQRSWDAIDSAAGILDNYCGVDLGAADVRLLDVLGHDMVGRALHVLQRCLDFQMLWLSRSSAMESLLLLAGRLLGLDALAVEPGAAGRLLPALLRLLQRTADYKVCDYVDAPCIFVIALLLQRFGREAVAPELCPPLAAALRRQLRGLQPKLHVQLDCLVTLGRLAGDEEPGRVARELLAAHGRLLAPEAWEVTA